MPTVSVPNAPATSTPDTPVQAIDAIPSAPAVSATPSVLFASGPGSAAVITFPVATRGPSSVTESASSAAVGTSSMIRIVRPAEAVSPSPSWIV